MQLEMFFLRAIWKSFLATRRRHSYNFHHEPPKTGITEIIEAIHGSWLFDVNELMSRVMYCPLI